MSSSPTPDPQVHQLRESSRRLVRVLGMVHGQPAEGMGCTPAQCHALIEIAAHGRLTTGEVAALLEVDKSTASRTLQPLLREGLLEAQPDPEDQRTKPMGLTAAGTERVRQVHAAADHQVRSALDLLDEEERGIVLRGISLYEQALHRAKALADLRVRPIEPGDDAQVANLVRTVMAEFGAVGSGYSSEDEELVEMHAAYSLPRTAYFVAEREGELIAGGGIAPLAGCDDEGVCELRKMHALPAARGLGLGRRLLEECIAAARAADFHTCYLETLRHMHRARALYEKFGFQPLPGPMGQTGHHACDGWYALELR